MNPLSPEGQAASLAKMKRYANGKYGDANAKPEDMVLIDGKAIPAKAVHEINELWASVANDDRPTGYGTYTICTYNPEAVFGTASHTVLGTATCADPATVAAMLQANLDLEHRIDLENIRRRERRWYRRLYRYLALWWYGLVGYRFEI